MERLITYLRVALPKLRDSGSTLGAEVELVASYLDLVQAMHDGRPQFDDRLPPALASTRTSIRCCCCRWSSARCAATPLPRRIELTAQASGERLRLG